MHKKLILYHYFYARPTDTENRDRLQQGAGVKGSEIVKIFLKIFQKGSEIF